MPLLAPLIAPLFVPATRPERIAKAAQSGADAVIVDLEDAVPALDKDAARQGLAAWLEALSDPIDVPLVLRINAVGSTWCADDLRFAQSAPIAGIMLPKTQTAADVAAVGTDLPVIGLIETARGVAGLAEVCAAPNLIQLAFGSIDYALDLGCDEARDALLLARLSIVTQSRAHGLPAPLDGVTVSVRDTALVRSDAQYAKRLGFGGKLAIHPAQIGLINTAFSPSDAEVRWAGEICEVDAQSGGAAVLVDGCMIDTPVIEKARRIIRQAALLQGKAN